MNNEPLTNYKQTIKYNVSPASHISPGKESEQVTYDEMIKVINEYIDTKSDNIEESQQLTAGLSKQIPAKITLHRVIKGLNMLIYDYINVNHKDISLQQKTIVQEYFNGVNSLSVILDNVDINVAENRFMSYIVGYMFKILKNIGK